MSTNPDDQTEVISFLENPQSYGFPEADVQRIDTHGAMVFLAGDIVFKIKRAVTYPYMDFSSLEKRRQACVRELEINQPHAPSIYLGLIPVTRSKDGRFAFDGDGDVVEWGVRMRRFRQADILDRVAERGEIDRECARDIADTISRYHDQAERIGGKNLPDILAAIASDVSGNLARFPGTISESDRIRFESGIERRIHRSEALLSARSQGGFVRHCHGDLHLQNIVLIDGAPILFDAIEFDDSLAEIDILYDLAFLLADLDHRRLRPVANMILNRYLFRQNDKRNIAGLGVMPVYLGLRHAIRAMVALQRAKYLGVGEQKAIAGVAKSYFVNALKCLDPALPLLIAVGGFSGSGKSTLGRNLAPCIGKAPGAVHWRSDLERKLHFGVVETDRLDESCYTQEISDQIYQTLYQKAAAALKAGHSVVVDAVFSKEAERKEIARVAKKAGARFEGLWLEAAEREMISRVENRVGDASDATAETVKLQLAAGSGPIGWKHISSSGTIAETLRLAHRQIELRPCQNP